MVAEAGDEALRAAAEVVPDAERVTRPGVRLSYGGDSTPFTGARVLSSGEEVDFGEIDEFFRGRASGWELTVGPWVSAETLKRTTLAGYVPEAFEGVLAQQVPEGLERPDVLIEEVGPETADLFSRVSDAGWGDQAGLPEKVGVVTEIVMRIRNAAKYLAWVDGEPAATAALSRFGDGCFLAGACTRVEYRGRGLQQALIRHRLAEVPAGQLCFVGAVVGSKSYRNMQRHGFVPLFTELLMRRLAE